MRGKLVWSRASDWTVTLSPYYTQDGCILLRRRRVLRDAPAPRRAAPRPARRAFRCRCFSPASRPDRTTRSTRMDVDAQGDAEDYGSGLKIAKEIGDFTLDVDHLVRSLPARRSPGHGLDRHRLLRLSADLAAGRLGQRRLLLYRLDDAGVAADVARGASALCCRRVLQRHEARAATSCAAPTRSTTTTSHRRRRRRLRVCRRPTARRTRAICRPRAQPTTRCSARATTVSPTSSTSCAGLRVNREEIEYTFYDLGNGVTFGSPKCSTTTPSGTADRDLQSTIRRSPAASACSIDSRPTS